jgi:hypothetical protein
MRLRIAGLFLLCAAAALGSDNTDELLARHLLALGGHDTVTAVRSLRVKGTIGVGSELVAFTVTKKRPNFIRYDVTAHGLLSVQAFDGARFWERSAVPATLTGASDIALFADFDGPLVDSTAKGYSVSLGDSPPDGGIVLNILRGQDIVDRVELDRDSFLVRRHTHGDTDTVISEYRKIDGLNFPVAMTRTHGGVVQQIRVKDVLINPDVADTFFKEPTNVAR